MVKYVANIHGDEAVTREILLGLAQHLVWNYGTNRRVTRLLNETEVKELYLLSNFGLWCNCFQYCDKINMFQLVLPIDSYIFL